MVLSKNGRRSLIRKKNNRENVGRKAQNQTQQEKGEKRNNTSRCTKG